MLSLFYRANFCAECGNEMTRHRWWKHRYLCAECAARLGLWRRAALFGLVAVLAAVCSFRGKGGDSPVAPTVSAWDATTGHGPKLTIEKPLRVQCGARTQRGTPCRHLVPPGERCAQHRGLPSMVPESPAIKP